MKSIALLTIMSATLMTSCSVGSVKSFEFHSLPARQQRIGMERPFEPDSAIAFETSHLPINVPNKLELNQNYPNPFNATTRISYNLQNKSDVTSAVYNLLGQQVRTFSRGRQNPGIHTIEWDGTDGNRKTLPSGVYILVVTVDGVSSSRKLVMLK